MSDPNSRFHTTNRRSFLQFGTLGALGISLPQILQMEAQAETATAAAGIGALKGKAKSVIHIYLSGGMAHQESWDPKPLASSEYRGPLRAIDTKVGGLQFGQHFGHMAKVADKCTVIHSMTHGEAAHERGTHNMFTGYRPSPAIEYPSMGSVIAHELGVRNSLPPYVMIPTYPGGFAGANFAGSGYLSSAFSPFGLGSDPAGKDFKVRDLNMAAGIDEARFDRRKSLLANVDEHFRKAEQGDALDAADSFYQAAYDLISSPAAREAFDLDKEDGKMRERYGKSQAGSRFLLARRLVEAGVRMVNVNLTGWDMHGNIKGGFDRLGPSFDRGLAALISDLDERGLLDSTLIVVNSEFGRTPKINPGSGRDHWPRVFSVLLAGGGVKRGHVHGASDALAAEPDRDPVGPEALAATIYHQLGIDYEKRLMSPGNRPIDIVRGGHVIKDILG